MAKSQEAPMPQIRRNSGLTEEALFEALNYNGFKFIFLPFTIFNYYRSGFFIEWHTYKTIIIDWYNII